MSDYARQVARYRVRLGFPLAAVALWLADPGPRSLTAGAVVACVGEALRIWAAGHLEKGREVTASGPYRLTRHPLYLGSAIIGAGFAVAAASVSAAVVVLGYLVVTLTAAMRGEEAHLTEKFGDAYPEYREGRAPAARRRFSLARAVVNNEHRAVAGLAAVLALLCWKAL
jgi:protein-S-isoprenylcysteine O-methyltransferase Ste14